MFPKMEVETMGGSINVRGVQFSQQLQRCLPAGTKAGLVAEISPGKALMVINNGHITCLLQGY